MPRRTRMGGRTRSLRARRGGWVTSTLVTGAVAGLLLLLLSDAAVAAPVTDRPSSDSPAPSWAFAGSLAVNQSTRVGNLTVAQSGSFAWATSISELSTGPWTFSLEVQRGMATQYEYRLCAAPCTAAAYGLTTELNGSEWTVAFLNLTAAAPAQVGSQEVGAVGLVNASVTSRSALTTRSVETAPGAPAAQEDRTVLSRAAYSVTFVGGLALFPTIGADSGAWSSSAAVLADGSFTRSSSTTYVGDTTPASQSTTTHAVASSGVLSVSGSPNGTVPIAFGDTAVALSLHTSGGFGLTDGLVPALYGASLYAPSLPLLATGTGLSENATVLDLDPSLSNHLAVPATSLTVHPYSESPTGAPALPEFLNLSAEGSPSWVVQAHPEGPAAAEAQFSAWGLTGSGPSSAPLLLPGLGWTFGYLPALLVGAAGVIGVVVALGVRNRFPPVVADRPSDGPDRFPAPVAAPPSGPAEPTRPAGPADPFEDLL